MLKETHVIRYNKYIIGIIVNNVHFTFLAQSIGHYEHRGRF